VCVKDGCNKLTYFAPGRRVPHGTLFVSKWSKYDKMHLRD